MHFGQTNEKKFKSANKASILSAIIPGSGQIYNKEILESSHNLRIISYKYLFYKRKSK